MIKALQNIQADYQEMKSFLVSSFFDCVCKDKSVKQQELNAIHKFSIAIKAFDLVSVAMSYLALNNYRDGARYYQTLSLLNDAKYLANSSNSLFAQKINVFILGLIEYYEKNNSTALNLLKASLYIKTPEEANFDEAILKYQQKIERESRQRVISSAPPSFNRRGAIRQCSSGYSSKSIS